MDKEKIITGNVNTAEVLNTFFSNTASNLNIIVHSTKKLLTKSGTIAAYLL